MPEPTLSDFNTLINAHIHGHEDLTHHLAHIEDIFEFMLTTNFTDAKPAALQAQLLSLDKLVHEAKTMNEVLKTRLLDKTLSSQALTVEQT